MVFVLNNIRSAWNVGSAFRTADCLGASIILCGYTPRPTPANIKQISKTAIGAEKWVNYQEFKTFQEVFEKYPSSVSSPDGAGIQINDSIKSETDVKTKYFHIAAEIDSNSLSVFDFIQEQIQTYDTSPNSMSSHWDQIQNKELMIWFGNEIHGVEPDLMAQCDKIIHLPMWGKKESLNVSSSLAAMGYFMKFLQELKG